MSNEQVSMILKQFGNFFLQKIPNCFRMGKDKTHILIGKTCPPVIAGLHRKLGYYCAKGRYADKRGAVSFRQGTEIVQIMNIGRLLPHNYQSAF